MERIVIINEEAYNEYKALNEMSWYRFNNNVRKFLSLLLAEPTFDEKNMPEGLRQRFTKNELVQLLMKTPNTKDPILKQDLDINDKDENGNPKTATMKVTYSVPKQNFERKLKRLYIKLYENNEDQFEND